MANSIFSTNSQGYIKSNALLEGQGKRKIKSKGKNHMLKTSSIGLLISFALLVGASKPVQAQKIKWVNGKMVLVGKKVERKGCKSLNIDDLKTDSNKTKKLGGCK